MKIIINLRSQEWFLKPGVSNRTLGISRILSYEEYAFLGKFLLVVSLSNLAELAAGMDVRISVEIETKKPITSRGSKSEEYPQAE